MGLITPEAEVNPDAQLVRGLRSIRVAKGKRQARSFGEKCSAAPAGKGQSKMQRSPQTLGS